MSKIPFFLILSPVFIRSLIPAVALSPSSRPGPWISFSSPQPLQPSHSAVSKIPIITTIFPLQEFARAVAGERGEVSLLLPPGAEVHTWQPRASDIRRLHRARLFITIGAGLEPWAEEIRRSLAPPGPKVLATAENLPLIQGSDENEAGGLDPHVWLDLGLAQLVVHQIREALSEIDPAGASLYASNALSYNAGLAELDREFKAALTACRHRILIIGGHAAFGYLARRYGLEQVPLYGLSPDAQPTPGRMIAAVNRARGLGVKNVFVEANTSPRLARALAREIGAELLVLNPGASPTKKQLSSGATFFDIMKENLRAIRKGLGCE